MNKINPELQKLINEKFTIQQKQKVENLLSYEKDRFIIDYTILTIAIEEDLVNLENQDIKNFYNIKDLNELNTVDILIARIIITLSKKLNLDIKKEYNNNLKLDKSQPELLYLIKTIKENY